MVIIGDLHLGPKELEIVIPGIFKKQLSTLDKIVQASNEKGHTEFLFAGDVFDVADPEFYLQKAFALWLRKKIKLGNVFHFILGNHDSDSVHKHSLGFIDLVRVFIQKGLINVYLEPVIKEVDGCKIFICPHPFIQDMPKSCKYAIGHFAYSGARADNGFVIKNKNNPKGNWILGDFHTPQRGSNFRYIGSVTQIKFNESPEKQVIIIEDGSLETVQHKPDYILDKAVIQSDSDFEKLDKNKFYMVSVATDYILPAGWQEKYPNVVKYSVEGAKNKKAQVLLEKIVQSDNPLAGFDNYMENVLQFTADQKKRSKQLLGLDPNVEL